ncbi:MAG: terminase small subunit [Ruminococcus sp.]|nr:terminase small subunit [Ruminococcus sp.]
MQEKDKKQLRDDFCCCYALLGSVEEAAAKAGFPADTALRDGLSCLRSPGCRKKIAELRELLSDGSGVIAGLKRLAFGNCRDAAVLAFSDELPPPEVIAGLDLFNVSEIKRVKGGGVEVKLFDRLKALEKLFELENTFSDRDRAAGLISALTDTAEEADYTEDR